MIPIIKKFLTLVKKHKIITGIIIVVVVIAGYFWYRSATSATGKVTYVSAPAEKGTIVVSVSGSGQVSASSQIDLKSKVSENVVYVGAKNGQYVKTGTLLMQFDTATSQKSVRNAQISLDNAKLSLLKLAGENVPVPLNKQQAEDNLAEDYNNGFNTVANTFLDLPSIMTGLQDVLYGTTISRSSQNVDYYADYTKPYDINAYKYRDDANAAYQKALASYNKSFNDYKLLARTSDVAAIDLMISQTYQTTQDVSDAIKNANNLIQFYEDVFTKQQFTINSVATTQLATLNTYTGKINTDLSNLLSTQSNIKSAKSAIVNSDLDLQSQNLSLKQAENSLADAKENLASCFIYAPFDGTVAAVNFNKGDAVSSGAVAVTIITNQSITKIPFNEVDIAKIKAGQKAVLTFDAIDGLTIAGQVAEIDTLGTVTQGVVNYNVKILFDTQSAQVRPGMSVSASVITDVKQDVLVVANSAIKQSGGQKYVQVLVNGSPEQRTVETGLFNDTDTEITSGLKEGESVVTQTITTTTAATASSSASSLRIPGITGGNAGFGGGVRVNAGGRTGN